MDVRRDGAPELPLGRNGATCQKPGGKMAKSLKPSLSGPCTWLTAGAGCAGTNSGLRRMRCILPKTTGSIAPPSNLQYFNNSTTQNNIRRLTHTFDMGNTWAGVQNVITDRLDEQFIVGLCQRGTISVGESNGQCALNWGFTAGGRSS